MNKYFSIFNYFHVLYQIKYVIIVIYTLIHCIHTLAEFTYPDHVESRCSSQKLGTHHGREEGVSDFEVLADRRPRQARRPPEWRLQTTGLNILVLPYLPSGKLTVHYGKLSKSSKSSIQLTIRIRAVINYYHLVLTNSLPWKDPPFLSSINHLFLWAICTMAMLNNQRVPYLSIFSNMFLSF